MLLQKCSFEADRKAVKTDKGIQILVIPTFLFPRKYGTASQEFKLWEKSKVNIRGKLLYRTGSSENTRQLMQLFRTFFLSWKRENCPLKFQKNSRSKKIIFLVSIFRSQRLSSLENFVSDILMKRPFDKECESIGTSSILMKIHG